MSNVKPKDTVIKEITDTYLDSLDAANLPAPTEIAEQLFQTTNEQLRALNYSVPRDMSYKLIQELTYYQVAAIVVKTKCTVVIQCTDDSNDLDLCPVAIYQGFGPNEGLYSTLDHDINRAILEIRPGVTERGLKEIKTMMRNIAPVVKRTPDRDLVPVANGIFDYKRQILLPFSPEYVFLAKLTVPYNPLAQNITIHNPDDGTDWDVESWMQELFNDQELVDLLWHIIGAVVRANVVWGRTAWFYSSSGNSGKGTILALLRSLIGREHCASIRMAAMDEKYALEPIVHATCILCDENNVGEYLEKSSNLKALVTGDTVLVTRKYLKAVNFQFRGLMVQLINDLPKTRDRTDSFLRRCLILEFDKCFTGQERKYIKEDYLTRPEVLEYVLYRVLTLMPQYYDLPVPEACKSAAEGFGIANNPALEFALEMLPQIQSEVVSFGTLYELYKSWLKYTNPSSTALGRNTFISELTRQVVKPPLSDEWDYPGKDGNRKHIRITVGNRKTYAEPLYDEFCICQPPTYQPSDRVAGLARIKPMAQHNDVN